MNEDNSLDNELPDNHWSRTEEGKQCFLDIINELFYFDETGELVRRDGSDKT